MPPLKYNYLTGFGNTSTFGIREAVIRFRRYNKDAEPSNWYRAKLMLYYPWYDEHSDLLGGYETYEQHYTHVKSVVLANESNHTHTSIEYIEVALKWDTRAFVESNSSLN